MSNDPIDPELLAAFIEGRLEPDERAALLERLARDPDAYETFADATAIERELRGIVPVAIAPAGETAGPEGERIQPVCETAQPVMRSDSGRWRYALLLAAAAGIVALLVGRALRRPRSPIPLTDASTLLAASAAGTLESALGPDWTDPAWPGNRGAVSGLSTDQRAFRIGSRFAVLSVAVDAGDGGAAVLAAGELRDLLAGVAGGPPVAARLTNAASGATTAVLQDIAGDLVALAPETWVRTGAWVEQARLAARAGAAGWFASRSARGEAQSLVALLRAESGASARSIGDRLENLLQEMTGAPPGRAVLDGLIPILDSITEDAAGR